MRRCVTALRKVRIARLLARILMIGFLALGISGIAHIVAHPAQDESPEVADLVTQVAEGSRQTEPIPNGVSASLGYEPATTNGKLTKATGSCSTPIPVGPDSFEEACRTHDLGYDLLRTAEEKGHRLGVWARFELDRRFYLDLLSQCETLRCRSAAATYYTAVTTNSIRQGYGAPTDEPATPWIGVGLLVVCFALLSDPRGELRSRAKQWTDETLTWSLIGEERAWAQHTDGPWWCSEQTSLRRLSPAIERVRIALRSGIWRHRKYGRSTV